LHIQRAKLGIGLIGARHPFEGDADDSGDFALAADWLALLHAQQVDYTLAWRRLGNAAAGDEDPLRALFAEPDAVAAWLARWRARIASEATSDARASTATARAAAMNRVNPIVIARNHRV